MCRAGRVGRLSRGPQGSPSQHLRATSRTPDQVNDLMSLMTSLCSPWWRLQLAAAELQSRWAVDRLDTSNPLILYSHISAWLLQASVFVQYSVHLPTRSCCSVFENLYCGFKNKDVIWHNAQAQETLLIFRTGTTWAKINSTRALPVIARVWLRH